MQSTLSLNEESNGNFSCHFYPFPLNIYIPVPKRLSENKLDLFSHML